MPNDNPNTKGIEPHKFQKGQSGNPKGRPKNRVPEALASILGKAKAKKFYQITEEEINDWERAILTMSANEIKLLASWEDASSYPKGLAISILFDMKNGNTKTLDRLRERQFGKATQRVELTGKDGADLVPARVLTKAEAKELLGNLENEF